MAASCMTKAFLGSSLAKAVPTQGKVSLHRRARRRRSQLLCASPGQHTIVASFTLLKFDQRAVVFSMLRQLLHLFD